MAWEYAGGLDVGIAGPPVSHMHDLTPVMLATRRRQWVQIDNLNGGVYAC